MYIPITPKLKEVDYLGNKLQVPSDTKYMFIDQGSGNVYACKSVQIGGEDNDKVVILDEVMYIVGTVTYEVSLPSPVVTLRTF